MHDMYIAYGGSVTFYRFSQGISTIVQISNFKHYYKFLGRMFFQLGYDLCKT